MEFAELIKERRTIQNFLTEKVPDAWVKEAIELSLWSPNHRLTFPWRYVLAGPQARKCMAAAAVESKEKKGLLSEAAKQAVRATVLNPSHVLMLGLKIDADAGTQVEKENYATLACSVQILSTALWEKGVGTKWSTSGFTNHPKTYQALGLSPSEVRIEGCLFIGKAAMVPKPAPRPPLSEVLRSSG